MMQVAGPARESRGPESSPRPAIRTRNLDLQPRHATQTRSQTFSQDQLCHHPSRTRTAGRVAVRVYPADLPRLLRRSGSPSESAPRASRRLYPSSGPAACPPRRLTPPCGSAARTRSVAAFGCDARAENVTAIRLTKIYLDKSIFDVSSERRENLRQRSAPNYS